MKDDLDEEDVGMPSSGTMTENAIFYGNPRASRNMAEKQRRDNLNTNISTMAKLVPTVAGSSRRMDKISVLRLTAAYLRTQYTLGSGTTNFLPHRFSDFDLEQYFVDNLIGNGGFLIVLTTSGKIVYVSRQVEQQLGHAQNELLGQSLYDFVYVDDHEELTVGLNPEDATRSNAAKESVEENSNSSEDSPRQSDRRTFKEQRRSFNIRISHRTVSRREHTQYECFHISGILRLADACKNAESNVANRVRRDNNNGSVNDIVFVGMARLLKKRTITELSLLEANKDEYVTRHLPDGRIIFCDHRISVIAGYMSEEVSGMSAFAFMHKEDVRFTLVALRQMYVQREGYGTSCYRLLSKSGEFIYLRTHGYLELDKKTHSFESFVCINTLMSKKEGEELVKEMKDRFSAKISAEGLGGYDDLTLSLKDNSNSQTSLEDPSQLEDAITNLIRDLPSPPISEDRLSPTPMPDTQFVKAAIYSQRLPPASVQVSKMGLRTNVVSPGGIRSWPSPSSSTSSTRDDQSVASPRSRKSNKSPVGQKVEPLTSNSPCNDTVKPVTKSDDRNGKVPMKRAFSTTEESEVAIKRKPNIDASPEVTYEYRPELEKPTEDIFGDLNTADEKILDLRDLQDDQLGLDSNSDFMKIFDDLRPVMPFENTADDALMRPYGTSEEVGDDELRRTQLQFTNGGAQFGVLERDLEKPAIQAQRNNFSQLQAEADMHKQMLRTLQQDRRSVQVNVKHDIGV